ncbi:tyrosine-type recombinase/integrase [Rhodobacterales bacterium HKCCSP123]|nr:tyrosine-type recombinase/integrase [Rhodobacterales bacterium HKCCSP123]
MAYIFTKAADWRSHFQRLEGAYAPSTMRAYRNDVEAFVKWCADVGIEAPFPASVETVCRFLEDQGETKCTSTVKRRLYAIRKVHRLLDLPDPTYAEDINLTLRRVRRSKRSRPKQAKGLTRGYLEAFLASEPDTPMGLRNRAMMSLGYDLLTRRSELVALRDDDFEPAHNGTYRFLIRRSKSDPFGFGRLAFCSTRSADLLEAWLDWRGSKTSWLFCPIYQNVPIDRSLSTTTVKRVIKSAAARCGEPPEVVKTFSGHSMRIGAAQDLLCRGLDTVGIMRAGGWKSVNVLARYLEQADHNPWV